MSAAVRMSACHSRRFKGDRPIGAATGQQSQPPRPCAKPPLGPGFHSEILQKRNIDLAVFGTQTFGLLGSSTPPPPRHPLTETSGRGGALGGRGASSAVQLFGRRGRPSTRCAAQHERRTRRVLCCLVRAFCLGLREDGALLVVFGGGRRFGGFVGPILRRSAGPLGHWGSADGAGGGPPGARVPRTAPPLPQTAVGRWRMWRSRPPNRSSAESFPWA